MKMYIHVKENKDIEITIELDKSSESKTRGFRHIVKEGEDFYSFVEHAQRFEKEILENKR